MVEEAADAEESVLRVGILRVAAGLIAPDHKVAGADEGCHALLVQDVALLLIHQHLRAIFQTSCGDGHAHVGRAGVRAVVVQTVVVHGGCRRQSASAVNCGADLAIQPQGVCLTGGSALLHLLPGHIGVLLCTGGAAVDVNVAHCIEHAIDLAAFSLHGSAHQRILGEAGCQNNAGHHAQLREHLTHNFQTGFRAGGGIHAANNVGCRHLGGIQNRAGHGQRGSAVALTAGDNGNVHSAVIVETGGVVLIRHQRSGFLLHHQSAQQNASFPDFGNAVVHLHALGFHLRGVLCRVQNVNQDNGSNAHHLKACADRIAQGILCEIVRVANCGGRLFEGVRQQRSVYRCCGVSQQVDRGGAHDDLKARVDRYRRGNAGCGLGFVKTMRNSHLSCPPYFIRSVALL